MLTLQNFFSKDIYWFLQETAAYTNTFMLFLQIFKKYNINPILFTWFYQFLYLFNCFGLFLEQKLIHFGLGVILPFSFGPRKRLDTWQGIFPRALSNQRYKLLKFITLVQSYWSIWTSIINHCFCRHVFLGIFMYTRLDLRR